MLQQQPTHPHRHTPKAKFPNHHPKPHNELSPQQITAPTNRSPSQSPTSEPTERHPPTSIPHPSTVPTNLQTCHSKSAEHRQNFSSVDNYHPSHHYHEPPNNFPEPGCPHGSIHPLHHHRQPSCPHGSIIACIIAEELQKDNIPINNRRSGQPDYSGNMINVRNRNFVSPKEADNAPCDLSYSNSAKQPFCQSRTETQHNLTRFEESVVKTRSGFVPVSASSPLEASIKALYPLRPSRHNLDTAIRASSPLGASRHNLDTSIKASSPLGASIKASSTLGASIKASSPLGVSIKASSPLGASIKASSPLGASIKASSPLDPAIKAASPLEESRYNLDPGIKTSSPLGASIYNLDTTNKASSPLGASRYNLDAPIKASSPLEASIKASSPLGASIKASSPLNPAIKAASPLGASRYNLDATTQASHLYSYKPSWNAEIPACPSPEDEQPEDLSRKPERKQLDTTKEIVRSESDVKFPDKNTIFRDRFNNSNSHLSSPVTRRHLDSVTSRVTSSPSNTSDGCSDDYNSGSEDKNKRPMKSEVWKTRGQVHALEGHNVDSEVVAKRRKR